MEGGFVQQDANYASNSRRRPTRRSTRAARAAADVSYVELDDNDGGLPSDEEYTAVGGNESGGGSNESSGGNNDFGGGGNDFNGDSEDDEDFAPGSTVDAAIELSDGELLPVGDDVAGEPIEVLSEDDAPLASTGPRGRRTSRASTRAAKSTAKGTAKRTTKRKPKAPKKPKIPYFTRITGKLYENHPYLEDVFPYLEMLPPVPVQRAVQPAEMSITLLPFQLEGLHWLQAQEDGEFGGGILADEMGMGKTIQTIGLFMADRTKRPNLVVGPTVALMQWKHEIEAHANGQLSVLLFHGANRTTKAAELAKYDVILTSYSVLESCYRKQNYGFKRKAGLVKEPSPLHAVKFYRVVLDEAHNIKDRTSGTAKAANNLLTEKRWCLTGTPLQNKIGELYSLVRFLKLRPFYEYFCTKCDCSSTEWMFSDWRHCDICGHSPMMHTNFFNHFMLKNIQKFGIEGDGLVSFQNIQMLLKNIMLRRTKLERADDLGLPPRTVEIRYDTFNEEEKDLYVLLYSDSRRKFNEYVAEGVVLNNYANIFTLITRMRQLADHPDLVLKKVSGGGGGNNGTSAGSGVIVCQICDDEAEEPIESKCHHKFCRLCVQEYCDLAMESTKIECPVCHIALAIDLQQPALAVDEQEFTKASIVNRIQMGVHGDWRSSTKIEALVEELYKLRSDRYTLKSIVFSQFTSMLDLIEWRLKRAGFNTVKLQGLMSPQQRDNTIKHFMENTLVEVFLVSLKAGGVALNLCEASQVFLMDPWWNPSVEWQSMDRVHRIGQKRPIKITRFCIKDSIELKIIELQEKKANMIHATINKDEGAINRLTPEDLQFLFMN